MTEPLTLAIAGGMEFGKLLLNMWFEYQKSQGKTPEEIRELFEAEEKEFDSKDPDDIPDV